MGLTQKNKKDFSLKIKNSRDHGENIIFIKGGSTIIGDRWVVFKDMRINVQTLIDAYAGNTSRRLFNEYNGILYVLISLDKNGKLEVIPSLSYNKKTFGEIKVFPDISNKLPLVLIRLQQDGSSDLKSFDPIKKSDIEVYRGYGNFTLRGPQGVTGAIGITGIFGITGLQGESGDKGRTGIQGETGIQGYTVQGVTGLEGEQGDTIPAFILDRS